MARARPHEQGLLLSAVLSRVHGTPRALVVLDLDSTLLDNRPRQAHILREYGTSAGLPALRAARAEHVDGWDLALALRNAGLTAAEVARHLAPFRRFWRARFFTSRACLHDVPVPGAPAYVRSLAEAGATIAYVTGRPPAMRAGTLRSLARHGFPVPGGGLRRSVRPEPVEGRTGTPGGRVRLLLKEDPALADDAWKTLAVRRVTALGEVVAAFDNEPAHVNLYARAWPGALCVHLDTDHSGRPVEVLERVPSIRDFRTLRAAALEDAAAAP